MKQVGVANEISDVKEVNERICILARTQFSVPKHLDSSLRVEEEVSLTLVTTLVSRSVPSIGYIAGTVTGLLLQQYATCQLRVPLLSDQRFYTESCVSYQTFKVSTFKVVIFGLEI